MYSNGYCDATVLTNVPIKDNQLFEVELVEMTEEWAGSWMIGFTTHAPDRIEFPRDMTCMTSGTWVIRENRVIHCKQKIKELRGNIWSLVVSRCVYLKIVCH